MGKASSNNTVTPTQNGSTIIPRDKHPVSRQLLSPNAVKVLYRLNKAGFDAYLVGGGVRDILLGLKPKDFDIATNATPEEIKGLFRNCRLIGRRFRLAHILFGREIIEVATFRGHHDEDKSCQKTSKQNEQGMLLRDNIYGAIEEDAERRDFSINALYYSIADFSIHDFANGIADINARKIKLIGEPETRYREDPVRMLRAIRFATKLDMTISKETEAPIKPLASLLESIPAARMFEEFNKLFLSGKAVANFEQLQHYGLLQYLLPSTVRLLNGNENINENNHIRDFILLALKNTDSRIINEQRVTPAFLFAALLWYPLQEAKARIKAGTQLTPQDTFFAAYNEIMSEQQGSIAIPKRFQLIIKDIWILQEKFEKRDAKRAYKTLEHVKFRAGFDFLLLRSEIEKNELVELAKWWQDFQSVNNETQKQMLKQTSIKPAKRGPRKRRPRKPKVDES